MLLTAKISNITKGSLHDGAGVRTVIYFKGCALRCQWCHNPETLDSKKEIVYMPVKCIGCEQCIAVCQERCHSVRGGELLFAREHCMRCGKCVDACPTGALSACGESKTVEEVFREIKKDEHYYKASGGGVTLSGGECLLQADFCLELLRKCKEEGIHTAIESALYVDYGQVEKVLPYVDFFYADLKIADSEKHKLYTGQGNELVIDNIRRLSQEGVPIVIRIPVIPTVNDGEEDMRALGRLIFGFSDGIKGIELLRYNPLASSKYKSVGKNYRAFATESQSDMEMGVLKECLQTEIGERFPVFFN